MNIINLMNLLYIILIAFGFFLLCFTLYLNKKNYFALQRRIEKNISICILIPARDESKVIENLLKSIENQTYTIKMKDVYIIVESNMDPTMDIAKKYGASVILRHHLELKRKGYALDEALKQLKSKQKKYDLYFFFDADNILEKSFIEKMLPYYYEGYDIVSGYRNCKNGNESRIASCATLTFSMLNTLLNQSRIQFQGNIILSGTGYFITNDIIKEWDGFPFHSLTEDYEMTLYSILHHYKMYYNIDAEFYDEQPITYQQSKKQRIRWIRGFIDARREYIPKLKKVKSSNNIGSVKSEIIGVAPYILMVVGALLFIIHNFICSIYYYFVLNVNGMPFLINSIGMVLLIYIILMLFSIYLLIKEKDTLNINGSNKIKTILLHPLFLFTYIPCAVVALLKKDISWEKIEHHTTDIR